MQELKKNGNDQFSAGQIEEAIATYSQCLEIDPDNDPFNCIIFCNRAAALMRVRRFAEVTSANVSVPIFLDPQALKDCNSSLDRNKEYGKAMSRKATCLGELQEWEECVRCWEVGLFLAVRDGIISNRLFRDWSPTILRTSNN